MRAAALALAAMAPMHKALAQSQVTITKALSEVVVQPDGNYVETDEYVNTFSTDSAARANAQQGQTYSPSLETLEIMSAETRKADGRVLPVALDSIQERLSPAAAGAGSFDDRRNKIIIFPDVQVGDAIAIRTRRTSLRTQFPGVFMYRLALSRDFTWNAFDTTITVPLAMTVNVDAQDISLDTREEGDKRIYHFHREHLPFDIVVRALSIYDTAPHAFATNVASWDQYAKAYTDLAMPKAAVTPEVQALSDNITQGVTDRRTQAQLIYNWVSRNIRYVNVVLGIGGVEPHSANTILTNRYGDCKDHVVLLTALLAARGIPAEMVIINYGNAYALSDVVNGAQHNHMISYLPEFELYLDTTAEALPFGSLDFEESGKQVLHLGSTGPVRRTTPLLTQQDVISSLRTTASLRADGTIIGTSVTTASGTEALALRNRSKTFQAGGTKSVIERLRNIGEPGYGTMIRNDPTTQDPTFTLVGNFTLDPRPEYLDGAPFAPPVGFQVLSRPGDFLLGRLFDRTIGPRETIACWSGQQSEEILLTLPPGRRAERLPKPVDLDMAGIVYHSVWRQDGDTINVYRNLRATMSSALCNAARRAEMAPLMDKIRADLTRGILIADLP